MLKQVRQGIIGDGKDYKIDGQNVLTKWMPEYLDKKYAEIERMHKIVKKTEETGECAVELFYRKQREKKKLKEQQEKMYHEIDKMTKGMDRQMLEDTITEWENKLELKNYLDYLKSKRREIKK